MECNPYDDGTCNVNLKVVEIFETDVLDSEAIEFFEWEMDVLKGRKEDHVQPNNNTDGCKFFRG